MSKFNLNCNEVGRLDFVCRVPEDSVCASKLVARDSSGDAVFACGADCAVGFSSDYSMAVTSGEGAFGWYPPECVLDAIGWLPHIIPSNTMRDSVFTLLHNVRTLEGVEGLTFSLSLWYKVGGKGLSVDFASLSLALGCLRFLVSRYYTDAADIARHFHRAAEFPNDITLEVSGSFSSGELLRVFVMDSSSADEFSLVSLVSSISPSASRSSAIL